VGENYQISSERLLFVGKPHRGTPGKIWASGVIDPREEADRYFFENGMAYWAYSREIAVQLYGDPQTAWSRIAMTNLVKCTNVNYPGPTVDTTTSTMAFCCVSDLRVIVREIQILKPQRIVFYTYSFFPELVHDLRFEPNSIWEDITPRDHRVTCGKKRLGWWERSCSTSWCPSLRVLIVGHPERKLKKQYVELVSEWARGSAGRHT
jgi:hypothetical protein